MTIYRVAARAADLGALTRRARDALSFVASNWYSADPSIIDEWFHTPAARETAWRAWRKLQGSPEPEEE